MKAFARAALGFYGAQVARGTGDSWKEFFHSFRFLFRTFISYCKYYIILYYVMLWYILIGVPLCEVWFVFKGTCTSCREEEHARQLRGFQERCESMEVALSRLSAALPRLSKEILSRLDHP